MTITSYPPIPSGAGVATVSATAPVVSTGGTTPDISMPAATTSVSGYLTSTDWNTFNNKGSGTVTNVTGTAPIVSSGGTTPAISMPAATTSVSGYLTNTDWTTFNNKQPAGSYLTAVTADAPLSGSGTSGSHLVIATANTTTTGALSSTDWNTFNNKGSGSVTSVAATVPSFLSVTGSPITTSGTLALTYSGTALPVANGGTGQTTATAAFNALSPLTTVGDTLYGGTSGAGTRLAIGTAGQVLTVNAGATAPQWSTPTTGTVTSVAALTLGTTGTDLSSTVATGTTTPVITLNVPTASATNRGALSAADWTTFNNKGSGTVTSVAATVPAFLSVTGSPITSSGTLAISYSGTALPVASGGTGVTTSTGTGSVVLSTRPTMSVTGAGFTLQDATDNTKQANFDLSAITTGTTRTYTLPNGTGAMFLLNSTGTYTGVLTFNNATQNFGSSTATGTQQFAYGATLSGSTKTVNIGTGGVSGSTTNITIGSTTSTSTTTINGITKQQTYTVATLPSASTSGVGARSFVTDALAPTFGATVVTGGAVAVPVYSDGTNWKVG